VSDESVARQDAPGRSVPSRAGPRTDDADRELALDLTREAVRLVARTERGWIELGAVPLAAGDFRTALDALRQRAGAEGAPSITIWLPPDQILVRRYVLKRGDRAAEALRRLAADTGHRARELTVALSPAADGELVTVLGASRQTVAEASDYARRWGFRPDRVSTQVEAERFGTGAPAFDLPGPAPRGMPVGARGALAASAAALGIGLASWGAYGLLPVADHAPLAIVSPPEAAAPLPEERLSTAPPARPHRQAALSLDAERSASAEPPGSETAQAGDAPAAAAVLPPEPAAAAPDAPVRLGRASAAPERAHPAGRPRSAAPEAGADLGMLLAGIDRIRDDDAEERPGQEKPAADEILLAASDAAPVVVPGRPLPRPAAPDVTEAGAEPDPHPEEEVEAEGSDVPVPAASMSDSRLAAVQAPAPPARPERPRQAAPAAAFRIQAAPPPVGSAAAQGSLSLDATSLIGVIDANTGREALLRTPSGDFLKVHRGDEVAGWRVNAIGQDAMRLTRGGESRTLLLVTR
jgi:hypothetical protein